MSLLETPHESKRSTSQSRSPEGRHCCTWCHLWRPRYVSLPISEFRVICSGLHILLWKRNIKVRYRKSTRIVFCSQGGWPRQLFWWSMLISLAAGSKRVCAGDQQCWSNILKDLLLFKKGESLDACLPDLPITCAADFCVSLFSSAGNMPVK